MILWPFLQLCEITKMGFDTMKISKKFLVIVVLFLSSILDSQARAECLTQTAAQALLTLRELDLAARLAEGDSDKRADAATQGLEVSNCCLAVFPNDVGCTFYRGVHQGWLLDARIKNVKAGLQAMKADFVAAENRQPGFEGGAPARALGNLYLSLPVLPLFGREFTRDLGLAQSYADKAMELSPKNPENLQLMGELALKRGDKIKAAQSFAEGLAVLSVPKNLTALQHQIDGDLVKLLKKTQ